MALEFDPVILPAARFDHAEELQRSLGWREDADIVGGADFRLVLLTPPGSACAVS